MLLSGILKSFNCYLSRTEDKNIFYLTFEVNTNKSIIQKLEFKQPQPKYCTSAVNLKKVGGGLENISHFLKRECFFDVSDNFEQTGVHGCYTINKLLTERQFFNKYYSEIDQKSDIKGTN
jgi:hypothetical protein